MRAFTVQFVSHTILFGVQIHPRKSVCVGGENDLIRGIKNRVLSSFYLQYFSLHLKNHTQGNLDDKNNTKFKIHKKLTNT